MKFFKYLFFLLLILFIGVALYFGTQDGDFSVTETRVIHAPVEVVFEHVNDFKNWEKWGSWMEDETLIINYPQKTSGEGATYSWVSKRDGEGAMQTISVVPNKEINQKIVFRGTLTDEGNPVTWTFEPDASGLTTQVTWSVEGRLGLFEKMYFATQEQKLEKSLQLMYAESLKNLDSVILAEMSEYSIQVHGIANHGGGFYLYNTTASKQNEIGTKTAPMVEQIENFMFDNNLQSQGDPFVIYNQWDEMNKTTIFSVAIHTPDMVILPDGSPVISGHMPPITAIKTTLHGNYTYLTKAWEETEKYIQENGFVKSKKLHPFEVYVTRFPDEKNPSKWVTNVYIPIENIGEEYDELY
jgi:uncharacterized protein YndB with AHSA1/START domain